MKTKPRNQLEGRKMGTMLADVVELSNESIAHSNESMLIEEKGIKNQEDLEQEDNKAKLRAGMKKAMESNREEKSQIRMMTWTRQQQETVLAQTDVMANQILYKWSPYSTEANIQEVTTLISLQKHQ